MCSTRATGALHVERRRRRGWLGAGAVAGVAALHELAAREGRREYRMQVDDVPLIVWPGVDAHGGPDLSGADDILPVDGDPDCHPGDRAGTPKIGCAIATAYAGIGVLSAGRRSSSPAWVVVMVSR